MPEMMSLSIWLPLATSEADRAFVGLFFIYTVLYSYSPCRRSIVALLNQESQWSRSTVQHHNNSAVATHRDMLIKAFTRSSKDVTN